MFIHPLMQMHGLLKHTSQEVEAIGQHNGKE
jgi:hypothetical protein